MAGVGDADDVDHAVVVVDGETDHGFFDRRDGAKTGDDIWSNRDDVRIIAEPLYPLLDFMSNSACASHAGDGRDEVLNIFEISLDQWCSVKR